ncbi:MAG: hypothetical protein COB02_11930 [Candidatus Cloacimonadota bacterium]|nr:MAG: hypothetical protein COB02_11930 [Candidatus Cloacimonadota bacterium]
MKILIIDDQFVIRQMIRDELETGGYEVFEASSGQEALIKLVQNPVDLITLDVEMPGMDGYTTCSRLRSDRYKKFISNNKSVDVPVIFITSSDSPTERQKGFDVGAIEYFSKPFEKGSILKTVNKILKPKSTYQELQVAILYHNETMRIHLASIARKKGVQYKCFNSIDDSINWMKLNHNHLGLVMIEHHSQEMPALDAMQNIQKEKSIKQTPTMIFWQEEHTSELIHFYKAGCSDSIKTPFIAEEISQKIELQLNRFIINKEKHQILDQLKSLDQLKDNFLNACSHDLRTPINSILGLSELLAEDIHDKEQKHFLEIIKDSCMQMTQMIDSLLSIGKIKTGKLKVQLDEINIHSFLESTLKKYIRNNLKKIDYKLNLQLKNPTIIVDPFIFQRIIDNILSNSTKFTHKYGTIQINANTLDNLFYQIQVTDTGIGIPEKFLPKLFDEYANIGRNGTEGEPSIGLGMHITKTLVSSLGGQVFVESEEEVGTNFTLTLPLGGYNG